MSAKPGRQAITPWRHGKFRLAGALTCLGAGVALTSSALPAHAAVAASALVPAQVQAPSKNYRDKISRAQGQLDAIDRKVLKAQGLLEDAQDQLPAAKARAAQAAEAYATAQSVQATAEARLAEAEAAVAKAQAEVDKMKAKVAELKLDIIGVARDVYRGGGEFTELEVLLGAQDPADFTETMQSIKAVSRDNNQTLAELKRLEAELQRKLEVLQRKEEQAQHARDEAAAAAQQAGAAAAEAAASKQRLDALVTQRSAALAVQRGNRARVAAQLNEFQAAQAAAAAASARAAQAQGYSSGGSSGDGGSSGGGGGGGGSANYGSSGGLAWPVPGYSYGSPAGMRFHPILHYWRCHAGADIGAPTGTPIVAFRSGTVSSAGWSGGYGNMVQISHAGGLSSVYGHMSSIAVSGGQSVSAGQVIGRVGSTGLSTGPHLHFEVHQYGTPMNPLGWFGGERRTAC